MIDFHTHILPYMDDGAKNSEVSIEMLKEEYQSGVETVCLTSHYYRSNESPEAFLDRRDSAYSRLLKHMSGELPAVILGAEVQYFEGMSNVDLTSLRLGDTGLLLVEMPFSKWSQRCVQELIDLNDMDEYQVVLAHIERYMRWNSDSVFEMLHDMGIIMQSNASFFTDWRVRHKAIKYLTEGLIDILGSDCHNMDSRPPCLRDAYEIIKNKCGEELVSELDEYAHYLIG